jgi:2-(1,2-epoxy-1,2-dihydrophenyl)acetyl-CoA isomerase
VADVRPVLLEVRDGVARITFNRPGSGNALDIAMAVEFTRTLQAVRADDAARAVLLTGNGRLFCAGGDLRAMHAAADRGAFLRELADAAHRAVRELAALDKPVVAAVHGSAAGAGLSIVLLSDLVLAAPAATFLTAYTSVGLTPDCGQSWLLPRAVGLGRALDLTLVPRRVPATEAVALGIATRVVQENSLLDEAHALAAQLASGPALALGQARALLRSADKTGFDPHLDLEAETIARMAATRESGALIDALLAPRSHGGS